MSGATVVATRWFSLRRHLLVMLLGGLTAGWLATMTFSYRDAHHEIDELFDAQLAQAAQTLLALASEYDDDDDVAELAADGHKYQKKLIFQLWDAHGHLLLRSRHAPTEPLTETDGFSDSLRADGRVWRYYSQWDRQRQLRVQVGEDHHMREELAWHIAGRLLVPGAFGLLLLGAPERLGPLVPAQAPEEIRPLLAALNDLFARVDRTLENERRFTADAAHELRTPLAALTMQAQVALRAHDAAERDHAIRQIEVGSRRASHLVEQLLTLARLDPAAAPVFGPVPLDTLAAEVCADHGPAALAGNIALELDATKDTVVSGQANMLRILLRNLVDNAIRYTPPGGKVGVGVTAHGDAVILSVADSGPGIPAAERENVLRRFHRLAGQDIEGSGLGLSIVARIAELHGARLELGDARPGLVVRVTLKPLTTMDPPAPGTA
jgi:two-component system sensor histidine kinase QseC